MRHGWHLRESILSAAIIRTFLYNPIDLLILLDLGYLIILYYGFIHPMNDSEIHFGRLQRSISAFMDDVFEDNDSKSIHIFIYI